MEKKARAGKVLEALSREYPVKKGSPGSLTELAHSNPLELLVATILSAQCTDERVNKTTPALFKKYRSASDYAEAEPEEIAAFIRSVNFFRNKAKSIKGAAETILRDFGGEVPRSLKELTRLPGVGRKTANIVLSVGYGIPALAVDTHVKRVSLRIGLSKSKDPEAIEGELCALFAKDSWAVVTYLLIMHGRRICKARNPLCNLCPVSSLCDYYQGLQSEKNRVE